MPRPFSTIRILWPLAPHIIGLVSGMTLAATVAFAQPKAVSSRTATRVAVYNSRAVFDSMPERVAVETTFAREQENARLMVRAASDSVRLTLDDFARAEAHLTPREREAAKLQLRARELLVEQMMENLDSVIGQRHEELRQPLLSRIRDAVRIVRVREGYHLVLDRALDGLQIEADDAIDITRAIVAELRRVGRQTSQAVTPIK